jgi:urate oxidase
MSQHKKSKNILILLLREVWKYINTIKTYVTDLGNFDASFLFNQVYDVRFVRFHSNNTFSNQELILDLFTQIIESYSNASGWA